MPPVGLSSMSVAAPLPSRSMASSACSGTVKRRLVNTVRAARRSNTRSSAPSRPTRASARAGSGLEEQVAPDPADDEVGAGAVAEIREDKGPLSSHAPGVLLHDPEVGADVG